MKNWLRNLRTRWILWRYMRRARAFGDALRKGLAIRIGEPILHPEDWK